MKYKFNQCIASKLSRLSRITDNRVRKIVTDFDITESQMNILFALSELGKVEQGKIGQSLVLERSSVSRSVRILEKRNMIQRTSEYRPEIELTEKGKDVVAKLIPLWEDFMDEICGELGKDGIVMIDNLEEKIA